MGNLIAPNNRLYKGPWLLNRKALTELANIFDKADKAIHNQYEAQISAEAISKMKADQYYADKGETIVIADLKERDSYRTSKIARLKSKNHHELHTDTLSNLLKDSKIENLEPISISANIKYGDIGCSFSISKRYGGEFEFSIDAQSEETKDILHEIDNWIEEYSPKKIHKVWNEYGHLMLYFLGMILLMTASIFYHSPKDRYQQQLKQEAHELLNQSDSIDIQNEAINILLQFESGYIPDSIEGGGFSPMFFWSIGFYVFFLIFIGIKPKPIIGLGKYKTEYKFYHFWIRFVLIIIPVTIIIPYIINLLAK